MRRLAIGILLASAGAWSLDAALVTRLDGTTVRGEVLRLDADSLELRTAAGAETVARTNILRIEFDDSGKSAGTDRRDTTPALPRRAAFSLNLLETVADAGDDRLGLQCTLQLGISGGLVLPLTFTAVSYQGSSDIKFMILGLGLRYYFGPRYDSFHLGANGQIVTGGYYDSYGGELEIGWSGMSRGGFLFDVSLGLNTFDNMDRNLLLVKLSLGVAF